MTNGAKSGGVYVEGVIGDISTLNPLLAASEPEQAVSRLLFSSLYNYDVTGALHIKTKQIYLISIVYLFGLNKISIKKAIIILLFSLHICSI